MKTSEIKKQTENAKSTKVSINASSTVLTKRKRPTEECQTTKKEKLHIQQRRIQSTSCSSNDEVEFLEENKYFL